MFDARTCQTTLENLLRDSLLYAFGQRLPQKADIPALRAVQTMGASSTMMRTDDDLITVATGGAYRWSSVSSASDDGVNVIKPNDVTANGRWIKWTSSLRVAQVIGNDASTLDQFSSGLVQRVIVLDKNMSGDDMLNLVVGQTPAIIIQSDDDVPEELTAPAGGMYATDYEFTIHVVVENLRDGRQAAQGSGVVADVTIGANSLDGLIQSLICGTALYPAILGTTDGIRNVRKGRGYNWISDLAERLVFRSRSYTVRVVEQLPPYASDSYDPTDVFFQAQLVALNQQSAYDASNYVVSGCLPVVGGALSNALSAGSAVIGGSVVTYAGQSATFPAWSDTYYDLSPAGTMTLIAVTANGATPAVTPGALRIGKVTTNSTIVTGVQPYAETKANFGPAVDVPI